MRMAKKHLVTQNHQRQPQEVAADGFIEAL